MASYYFNNTLHKITAAFGTMFNEIYVGRADATGNLVSQKRVPLLFGPRKKFLERIEKRNALTEDHVAINLPIISFESEAPIYDPERQKGKLQTQTCHADDGSGTRIYQPVPYKLPMTVSVAARNHNEAHQIVEQILPRFAPSATVRIRPVDGFSGITDTVKIVMNGISKNINYEGQFQEVRELVYTLSFDVSFYLFGDVKTEQTLIKNTIVSFKDVDGNLLAKETVNVDPQSANKDDEYTLDITWLYGDA